MNSRYYCYLAVFVIQMVEEISSDVIKIYREIMNIHSDQVVMASRVNKTQTRSVAVEDTPNCTEIEYGHVNVKMFSLLWIPDF